METMNYEVASTCEGTWSLLNSEGSRIKNVPPPQNTFLLKYDAQISHVRQSNNLVESVGFLFKVSQHKV